MARYSNYVKNYTTPHCHVQSLDSASTPEAFVERELELGTGTITVTDHGSLVACRKVYDLGKKAGLTPILGIEAYFRDDDCPILTEAGIQKKYYDLNSSNKSEAEKAILYPNGTFGEYLKYCHLTIHFLDQAAYETGVRLLSIADGRAERHGQERKPLFNWANLEELGAQNVTMTSGCLIGMVQRHMLDNNNVDLAKKYYNRLKSIVKPGNFYVEVFPHKCDNNWVQGIFLELGDGRTLKYYSGKVIRTNVGEFPATQLAKEFAKKGNEHKMILGVKNRSTWEEMESELVSVKEIADFMPNECRPWAPDGDVQRGLNRVVLALARTNKDPVLVSDDSHFAHPEEKIVQDVRLAQGGGAWRFSNSYHRQSSEESYEHFKATLGTSEKEFEGWVENSKEWSGRFKDFKFETTVSLPTKFYEPKYCEHPWHKNTKIEERDHSLMYTMELIKKHGRMDWSSAQHKSRLQEEIKLLHNNEVIDLLPYFFIVEEACSVYEDAGLLTGPGRGSAAGLLLTYLLGITHVDPLRYGLSLERFLTLDRIRSGRLPDIDQDLPHRDLLINGDGKGWLPDRFGDHYAQISVDTKLKLKMAVKDVARFSGQGQVPEDIEKFTRRFMMPPQGVEDYDFIMGYDNDEGHVVGSIEYDPVLKEYISRYPKDWEIVKKCLGLARSKSRHACAFIIANRPIHEFIPLQTVSGVRVTSYTAKSVEAVGGLKYDFLIVNSLNDLGDAIKLVQQRSGVEVPDHVFIDKKKVPKHRILPLNGGLYDIWDLPEDQDVFADVSLGRTETVFQFNTPAAVKWLSHFSKKRPDGKYAINSINDMAAFTALDRPGPLDINVSNPDRDGEHNMLVEYARRSRGDNPSKDVLPIFDELAPETYGVMTYQEQLQRIYQNLTGCTGSEAEEFRSNVAKKDKDKLDKAYPFFMENASQKIGEEAAKEAWAFFATWAKYGFNKSHAVCYADQAYACAFLKHHYPLEWWTSVLKNAAKAEVNEKFWRHCGKLIELPDVNLSGDFWEIQNERIRAPLSLLQGVGEGAHRELCLGRPYTSIKDFVEKVEKRKVETGTWSTKQVEKLVIDKDTGKRKRWLNPETGKKENVKVMVEEQKLTKGHSALNRKIVYTLILSGAMDSFFTADMIVSDKLQAYEQALAEVVAKPGKDPKVEAVDPKYSLVSPAKHFQMRKAILPAYGQDLLPIVIGLAPKGLVVSQRGVLVEGEHSIDRITKEVGLYSWWNDYKNRYEEVRLVNSKEFEFLQSSTSLPGETLRVAMAVYVESKELRHFGDERKEMCKTILDIEGGRYDLVKWPNKENVVPPIFKTDIAGCIAIGILSRYKTEGNFSLDDLVVVEQPLDHKEKEEKNEKPKN